MVPPCPPYDRICYEIVKAMTTGASFTIPVPAPPPLLTASSAMANATQEEAGLDDVPAMIADHGDGSQDDTVHNRRAGWASTGSKRHED
jgi:hypothetical protein